MNIKVTIAVVSLLIIGEPLYAEENLAQQISTFCQECGEKLNSLTGAYILEDGEDALISRAWLTQHATSTIDAQYFIWSTDNIGTLSTAELIKAANRGVRVRVIVDDLLIDVQPELLVSLASQPNIQIKVYNPKHSVGVTTAKRLFNILTDFRGSNQRMHDKTAIFDGAVGITGGRNMASEYFDYNHTYNFRDRDILLIGKTVESMTTSFNKFWESDLSVSVLELLKKQNESLSSKQKDDIIHTLHEYAQNDENYSPEVKQILDNLTQHFPQIAKELIWTNATFVSDAPGKNSNHFLLSGGGQTTSFLAERVSNAKHSVLIQSPYLVLPEESMDILSELIKKGVAITISTNSLASTDNLMAFSGYQKQRKKLLEMGISIYEYKPHPAIQNELVASHLQLKNNNPIFAIHAKSMVIDNAQFYIGTFNLDPRSTNLNTEVGIFIENSELAKQLTASITRDIQSENSWEITKQFNPDKEVSVSKRFKATLYRLVPMQDVL